MIYSDNIWYTLLMKEGQLNLEIDGKWLLFGQKNVFHSWLEKMNCLVESKKIKAIKVSRKLPEFDPFPQKPCVICFYTSDSPEEKQTIKNLILNEFNIEVFIWKSDRDTIKDWSDNGWLKLEAALTRLVRKYKSEQLEKGDIEKAKQIISRLETHINSENIPSRIAEFKKSGVEDFIRDNKVELLSDEISLKKLFEKIEDLEKRIQQSHLSYKNENPDSSDLFLKVKRWVANDELDKAISSLYSFFEQSSSDMLNDLILLSGQLAEYKRKERLGMEPDSKSLNRIRYGILE
ncbi:MAG: hypothetical protein AAF806_19310 [Bacteroidota bacterium]